MAHEQTVIIYHGKCPDGFGGAYAAWKKFGDSAEYIPVQYSKPIPEHMSGRDIYFVDFCYERERMDELAKVAKSITVLDHHEGVQDVATTFPGVFDARRSGASITWAYFHPETPVPYFIHLLEDYDLFRFSLPDTKACNAYLTLEPYDFERWDEIATVMNDPGQRESMLSIGRIYAEHTDKLVEHIAASAEPVAFEGHTVYLSGSGVQAFTDFVGNKLAREHPPFALMVRPVADGIRGSIRCDGTVGVTEIARRYGGNGHTSSAAFRLAWGAPIPWTPVPKEDEGTSH